MRVVAWFGAAGVCFLDSAMTGGAAGSLAVEGSQGFAGGWGQECCEIVVWWCLEVRPQAGPPSQEGVSDGRLAGGGCRGGVVAVSNGQQWQLGSSMADAQLPHPLAGCLLLCQECCTNNRDLPEIAFWRWQWIKQPGY